MARLQISKPSAFIDGFCKNAGVRLRNFKSPAEFEQEVVMFIEKHDMVFLATSAKDFPRCTPLGYRNLGTTLYIEPVPNSLISVVCTTHSPFSADTQLADCIKTEHSCVFFSLTPYCGRNSPVRFFRRSFFSLLLYAACCCS